MAGIFLPLPHGHTTHHLLHMVIRFMPQGNPLFLERLKPLVVNVQPGACGILWHIVPEDVAHVVEELRGREYQAGRSGRARSMCSLKNCA